MVGDINANLDAAVSALEGLLVKKAGMSTRSASSTASTRRGGTGLPRLPESREITPPRIAEVYTRGTLTLARLGREAPIATANPAGPVLRDAAYGSAAARTLYPEARPSRSPVIGTGAPGSTSSARTSDAAQAAQEGLMQTPAPFGYERATSVEGAIASLQRLGPEARVIAGGHSLLPMMKLRLANPEHLVDINDLAELAYIREEGDEVRIGALTRHVDLLKSDLLAEHFPIFRDAEEVIADPVVRNRGTIGGSLCQADAAEDLSAVCSALKATVVIRGPQGERTVSMEDFHVGPYMTAVQAGELLTEIRIRAGRRRQRAREGRAARGRLGDRRRLGRRVDGRQHDRRRRDRAQRRRAHDHPPEPRRGAAARQGAVGRPLRAGRRDRGRGLRADGGRPRAGRLQAPPGGRPHPARAAGHRTSASPGGLSMEVSITVNGEQHTRDVEPRMLLVHFLRDTLDLTGTHWGCDTSNCGACVVLMDGEPVKSCTILAAMARATRSAPSRAWPQR